MLHDGDVVLAERPRARRRRRPATPLTTEHRFRIASHSKTFTATAVVQLAEQGRLRLDDTVGAAARRTSRPSRSAAVTLRELLAHGGGVVRDGWDGDHWQLVRPFPDARHAARGSPPTTPPCSRRNERFKYSNIGFSLLGAVIEAVTGRSLRRPRRATRLLRPARASTATTPDIDPAATSPTTPPGTRALAYAAERIPIDHIATGAMAAATGFSLDGDRPRALGGGHFLGDERILSDDAKRQMQHTEWTVEGAGEYGLGLAIADGR